MSAVTESSYWSVFDAAVFFGVHEDTIRRMVRDGELEHIRVRGAIRIPRARPGYSPLRTVDAAAEATAA